MPVPERLKARNARMTPAEREEMLMRIGDQTGLRWTGLTFEEKPS